MISNVVVLFILLAVQAVLGDTEVQQLGQSGKFRISNQKGASDPNSVTVEADSVYEIPKSGNNHGTPTMANQDFSIDGPISTTVGTIPANKTIFLTNLTANGGGGVYGTFRFDTYLIEQSGNLSTQTETFNVNPGDVKFNIVLSNWTFAAGSQYVDVALIIKGRSSGKPKQDGNNKFDLGGNVPLILSGRVVVDGVEQDMPSGYPTVVQTGNKYTFVFRFPKFNDKATYDPIVAYSLAKSPCCFGQAALRGFKIVREFLDGSN